MTRAESATSGSGGHKVLIVGCGELGSRHLQALASLPVVTHIEVLDPRSESLQLGRDRVDELAGHRTSAEINWITSIEDATHDITNEGGLCVIATQAKGRCELLRSVADKLGYTSFLLEKIADQSLAAIEDAVAFCHAREISAWVNCQTRIVPTYHRIKKKLTATEPIYFNAAGGMQYLATNGIHTADLFAYYDECTSIEEAAAKIDPVVHSSKRGKDLYDLNGTLHGTTEKGSSLTISYIDGKSPWGHISIASSSYRCVVDHQQGWMAEADIQTDWAWRQAPFEGSMMVSQTTKEIAENILASGTCGLPTLEESLVSHRFILNGLLPHFSALLGQSLDSCPVS